MIGPCDGFQMFINICRFWCNDKPYTLKLGSCAKLSPRYCGPFEVLERIGPVAYRLALPTNTRASHNVFHVSLLNKYVYDPNHVINWDVIQVEPEGEFRTEQCASST